MTGVQTCALPISQYPGGHSFKGKDAEKRVLVYGDKDYDQVYPCMTATGIRWKPGFDWQAEKITILDRNIEKKSSG